jgi:hypothetical protein
LIRRASFGIVLLTGLRADCAGAQESVVPPSCHAFVEDSVQTLAGMLVEITFPGPPNFESVAGGDSPETVMTLALPQPLCWSFENHVFHAQVIQLIGNAAKSAKSLAGREVKATGMLREAMTGHDHTAIVLELQKVQLAGS